MEPPAGPLFQLEARIGKSVYAGANHPSLVNFLQYAFKVQKAVVGSKTAVKGQVVCSYPPCFSSNDAPDYLCTYAN